MRGGTITLNFYDPDGHLLDYRRVEELRQPARASRSGPAASAIPARARLAEGLTESDMLAGARRRTAT